MAAIPIFGRRVTRIREERGLTQQELATKAGTSYQTIWRIENGKHAEPGIYIARQIARALGVSLDFLVDLHGENKDSEGEPASPQPAKRGRPRKAAPVA
jgi:transcriptional regulator with XRE-family HTH domain